MITSRNGRDANGSQPYWPSLEGKVAYGQGQWRYENATAMTKTWQKLYSLQSGLDKLINEMPGKPPTLAQLISQITNDPTFINNVFNIIVSAMPNAPVSVSADTFLTIAAYSLRTVLCSGTHTQTLDTAVGYPGWWFRLKNMDASLITTIATTGGQTIDGQANATLQPFQYLVLESDNANYNIIGEGTL